MDDLDTFPNPNKPTKNEFSLKRRQNEIILDQAKLKNQFLVNLGPNNDIPVYFPYDPYPLQIAYMEKVIEALETKQNALLQSPTGTGKTLCLLCASLAWLNYKRLQEKKTENKKGEPPIRLLYSSRTHAQLRQVMKELKSTVYKPFCTTIGSRDHYCIKREFMHMKGTELNANCAKARKMRSKVFQQEATNEDGIDSCRYYQTENELMNYTVPKLFNPNSIKGSELMDIEDLKTDGKINKYCPYYVSMKIVNDVDILFLPYNYLLEKKIREILKLSLENTAIIFDEAHNIEQIAEEGSSYDLTLIHLETALEEINELRELHRKIATVNKFDAKTKKYEMDMPESLISMPEDCQLLEVPIKNFLGRIKKILDSDPKYTVKQYSKDEKGILLESKDIFEFIENLSKGTEERNYFELDPKKNPYTDGWKLGNLRNYIEILQKVVEDLSFKSIFGLDHLLSFLNEIFNLWTNYSMVIQNQIKYDWEKGRVNHYKLYIRNDSESPTNVLMYLWCFSPALSFHDLMQNSVRNIMLTSGTLAPFKSFEAETKLDYRIILSNPHIVNTSENLLAGIFQKGPQGNVFNFSYNNRDKEELFVDMGETFINLARQIPNGILIIFASYQLLEKSYGIWSKTDVLRRLEEIKSVIKEPRSSSAMNDRMLQYVKLARTKGAILLAVCRGKIAEGIDFSDELARAVLMVGIPFPPIYDRRVELKQRYLDVVGLNRVDLKRRLSGKEWYLLQAIRAMNQAIGRVIRHKNDYGCVLFFDVRFNNSEVKKEISGWVRDEIKVFENFGHGYKEVLEFFRRKKQPTNATQLNSIIKKSLDANANNAILTKPAPIFQEFNLTNENQNNFSRPTAMNNNKNEFPEKLLNKPTINNPEFIQPFKPELKKIKQTDTRENHQVLDSMNELLALDFENITKNMKDNSIIKPKTSNENDPASVENSLPNVIDQENLSKASSNSENPSQTQNPITNTTKKAITLQDLRTLGNRDDLRNCVLTLESVEDMQTFKDFLNQKEKFECMICLCNKEELMSSKCGHLACLECWKRWLKEKLVCPKCKARVREKGLIRVFNN